jgi:hypothetical protein
MNNENRKDYACCQVRAFTFTNECKFERRLMQKHQESEFEEIGDNESINFIQKKYNKENKTNGSLLMDTENSNKKKYLFSEGGKSKHGRPWSKVWKFLHPKD